MNYPVNYSVSIWLNHARIKNELTPIYARITVNGERANLSLQLSINDIYWDKKHRKIKGNCPNAMKLNTYLENFRSKINDCYQELYYQEKPISAIILKRKYLGQDVKRYSMADIIAYHNEEMQHLLHKATMRHYKTSQNFIRRFIKKKYTTSDIYLDQLNYNFIVSFEHFLRSYQPRDHQKPMSNNTAMKHIQRLRKMINLAHKMEWIEKDPFKRFKTRIEKKTREFLNQVELRQLEDYQPKLDRLSIIKDIFIFSCYTGLSFSDLMLLKRSHLSSDENQQIWIFTKRIKTNEELKIPLLPKALDLVSKYQWHPRTLKEQRLFPEISNQKTNAYLKEIAHICGISKKLTFHVARHTFATTITLNNGVPIETVSKLLGHTKLATTQIYARVLQKKVAKDMEILKSKLN
ncbi:site-specific integrase [Zunongwangia atlantica]|uniref:Transposase n=1 Tax=Zunongwangia atlantica 22II14-10F7 TaxID=1185767 RepID=A0A1Y1SY14_9FLAO|nr:site-specific integrase [Zunongwangia atlantica]ORL43661.1 transposase [Zunongwangia atlantica 22II14-10F7]